MSIVGITATHFSNEIRAGIGIETFCHPDEMGTDGLHLMARATSKRRMRIDLSPKSSCETKFLSFGINRGFVRRWNLHHFNGLAGLESPGDLRRHWE
jgi:hypothetical protein